MRGKGGGATVSSWVLQTAKGKEAPPIPLLPLLELLHFPSLISSCNCLSTFLFLFLEETTMSDPLSIVASVLGIAAAAFQGCKKVNDFISAFVNVPKVLKDLQKDLDTIQILLQSLETALVGTDDESLSESQKACFRDLKPALCDCRDTCDEFAAKLFDLTKHSKEGKVNWRDRIRVQFGDEEIELCKSMLQRYISTLDIAIGLATL